MGCSDCPRHCNAPRDEGKPGFCGADARVLVARASLHLWEEPFISGIRGSGTVFFSGCNLHCVYCQNREISGGGKGRELSPKALGELFLRLQDAGAHNINLVTPTHYARAIAGVLEQVKPRLQIPVVYNCGGYESVEMLERLEGLVDIYLPDMKYFDGERAKKYSHAPDYFSVASQALGEMLRQTGRPAFDGDGMLKKGTAVRHLVLPGGRKDSVALLEALAERFGTEDYLLSLMNQYTPQFAADCSYPELHRHLTSFEYDSVAQRALELGFSVLGQGRNAATADYTPDFQERSFLEHT